MLSQQTLEAIDPGRSASGAHTTSAVLDDLPRGPRDALLADIAFATREHLVVSVDSEHAE